MTVIACVDDGMGMLFNHRRQSMDRAVRARMLALAGEGKLRLSPYSAGQFPAEDAPRLRVGEDFLAAAGPGAVCFAEDCALAPYRDKIDALVLYRWNRRYPADTFFPFDPAAAGLRRIRTEDFTGYSHERITEEVYAR